MSWLYGTTCKPLIKDSSPAQSPLGLAQGSQPDGESWVSCEFRTAKAFKEVDMKLSSLAWPAIILYHDIPCIILWNRNIQQFCHTYESLSAQFCTCAASLPSRITSQRLSLSKVRANRTEIRIPKVLSSTGSKMFKYRKIAPCFSLLPRSAPHGWETKSWPVPAALVSWASWSIATWSVFPWSPEVFPVVVYLHVLHVHDPAFRRNSSSAWRWWRAAPMPC